ncbi:MAG: hypothetical protein EAX86_13390 [Candidatus Heimdallarchaeota archaeon]|nr:hypothetical protein [Candidatus Heimdallarchaeota archaeon]
MKDKFEIIPKRIARSRKIQVRQFEPEEIWIEYELNIKDPSSASEAVREATNLAIEYLDDEERKLRSSIGPAKVSVKENKPMPKEEEKKEEYTILITDEGKKLGNFLIKPSSEPQFLNYVHLWLEIDKKENYIGYMLKNTGEFKLAKKNKDFILNKGIAKGKHFKIIEK